MAVDNPKAVYACGNYGDAVCPKEIKKQAVCINGNMETVLDDLLQKTGKFMYAGA